MSYKLRSGGGVIRVEDGACIPPTTDNVDWLKYLAFVAGGGTTLPADPEPIPASAPAMLQRQRLDAFDAAVAKLPADQQEALRALQLLQGT